MIAARPTEARRRRRRRPTPQHEQAHTLPNEDVALASRSSPCAKMLRSSAASTSAPAPADAKAAAAEVPVSTISLDVAPGEDEKEEVLRAMLSVAEAELTAKDVQVDLMRRMLSSTEQELRNKDERIADLHKENSRLRGELLSFTNLFNKYLSKSEAARAGHNAKIASFPPSHPVAPSSANNPKATRPTGEPPSEPPPPLPPATTFAASGPTAVDRIGRPVS